MAFYSRYVKKVAEGDGFCINLGAKNCVENMVIPQRATLEKVTQENTEQALSIQSQVMENNIAVEEKQVKLPGVEQEKVTQSTTEQSSSLEVQAVGDNIAVKKKQVSLPSVEQETVTQQNTDEAKIVEGLAVEKHIAHEKKVKIPTLNFKLNKIQKIIYLHQE